MQAAGLHAIALQRSSAYAARNALRRRCLHQTGARYAITNLEMPAMSPTMTEGGIASWKKKEGEAFSAGDVLLEIETDKATIDVEAQEDGILGKIIAPDGTKNVLVGRIIALLAEEGDDISNLEAPAQDSKPSPAPSPAQQASSTPTPETAAPPAPSPAAQEHKAHGAHPTHSKHLLPSVIRLLIEGGVSDAEVIKGTGVRGMLTKGDVLAYLGKASSPLGTYKAPKKESAAPAPAKVEPPKVLDGAAVRQLIVSGLSAKMKPAPYVQPTPTFDAIIADYLPPSPSPSSSALIPQAPTKSRDSTSTYFDGLF
ncbi:hypothetical protein HYDPIDRAFT_185332 [Hydnomerulius pinastri MD-312]|nr:hypothetical protein HYDPIDRAFT_185332 [Hydnomerulius pinastri MD-312]